MSIDQQQDLPLKVQMRRLLWRIGYSARINIPLRAYVRPQAGKSSDFEEYTDLDVLGVAVGRDVRVETVIADCKTTEKRSTERMFWLKGVAHFFESDTAYLVRQTEPTRAARQLANRLKISIVTSADFQALEEYHPLDERINWKTIESFFTLKFATRSSAFNNGLDKRLAKLVEYCKFDFWGYEQYRNLTQIGAHLRECAPQLNVDNPVHVALVLDCAWLFVLTLCYGLEYVRRSHIADIKQSLSEYVFGGQLGLREKESIAGQMRRLGAAMDQPLDLDIYPPGFDLIVELITRLSRRPNSVNNVLRYAELAHCAAVERTALDMSVVFNELFDELALKLFGDVLAALVNIGKLDVRFRDRAKAYYSGNLAVASAQNTDEHL